jgi:DNA-binding NarL/FixJ family response regulator
MMAMGTETLRTLDLLIVESRKRVRRELRELIEQSLPGRTILEATDGQKALAMAVQHHPRVVVMSHHLRNANGIELIQQFRDELSDAAVIVLTELQSALNTATILWNGAFACVHTSKIDTRLVALATQALNLPKQAADEGVTP